MTIDQAISEIVALEHLTERTMRKRGSGEFTHAGRLRLEALHMARAALYEKKARSHLAPIEIPLTSERV